MITIIQQGAFTTIQDEGRWGYQAYGMPNAGAMDQYACRVANLLVGNQSNAAVIEMTTVGASFKFDEAHLVAVCGADMQVKLNGVPISNWSSVVVPRRGELKFNAAISGCRTYLAIRGGVDVPEVLGSRSTYTRARVGGFEGRILQQGDVLYVGQNSAYKVHPGILDSQYIPQYTKQINLRVILGPQDDMFDQKAKDTFFASSYQITDQTDRASYRLEGPKILHSGKAHIVSDAVCLGAIQIFANGMPVIMTADHRTTDGFAKLGSVIRADLSKLAQTGPGDTICFTCVAEQVAIRALEHEKQSVSCIMDLCKDS